MSSFDLFARDTPDHDSSLNPDLSPDQDPEPPRSSRAGLRRTLRLAAIAIPLLLILAVAGVFGVRAFLRHVALAALPQIDGTLAIPGISAPVTVQRDAHGVPHLRAARLDDLIFAQGFVTAQDRLWQMDMLR